jgi:hypothetical protein
MFKLDKSMFTWNDIVPMPAGDLIKTREQLHHAVQFIAAAGKYLIEERPDDSHTSMQWDDTHSAFEGETIKANQLLRIGLSPADFGLYLRVDSKSITATFDLNNNKMEEALTWLIEELKKYGVDTSRLSLNMHYEIPATSFRKNEPFSIGNQKLTENFGQYYANAHHLLNAVKQLLSDTSEIRCWPHHFDIATLLTIDKDKSSEEARSIGIGLAAGGDAYKEPYIYLTPWPYPDIKNKTLPDLTAGRWHTEGWVGAVLHAPEIYSEKDQSHAVIDFINSALPACGELLSFKL